jgi:hypothetical protein
MDLLLVADFGRASTSLRSIEQVLAEDKRMTVELKIDKLSHTQWRHAGVASSLAGNIHG